MCSIIVRCLTNVKHKDIQTIQLLLSLDHQEVVFEIIMIIQVYSALFIIISSSLLGQSCCFILCFIEKVYCLCVWCKSWHRILSFLFSLHFLKAHVKYKLKYIQIYK